VKNKPPLDQAAIRRDIAEFLASEQTLSLATVDDSGQVHAANLWYAQDDRGRLYFISHPDSAHSRHLARNPRVAATIHFATARAGEIHGVQLRGRCDLLGELAQELRARSLFAARFPQVLLSPDAAQRLKSERFYRITPLWLRWIDNRRGFGFKVELAGPSLPEP
jgi:uncharacterized protein YhbP (UPF0306 family)